MLVLTTTADVELAPGEVLVFDEVLLRSGCGECHRRNTGIIKMRANGIYNVHFHGNIGATAQGVAQLAAQIGGVTLPETVMISTTAAAGDLNNVSMSTKNKNCCGDFDQVTIVNTGATTVTVRAGALFSVNRLS